MRRIYTHKYGWVLALGTLVLVYYLAGLVHWRLDLTAEKRYTISTPMRNLLGNLDRPVEVTILLSGADLPVAFKKLSNSTDAFLHACRNYSNGQLRFRFVDSDDFVADSLSFPMPDSVKMDWLKANALKQNEVTRSGTRASFVYPLALVTIGEYYAAVNLLKGQGNKGFLNPDAAMLQQEVINKAEAQLEYNFASAIQSLIQTRVQRVGYTIGHGQPTGPETFDLSQTLQSKYDFFLVDLPQIPVISDSLDVLMVVKPSMYFDDAEKLKLDQYLMRGGNILFLLDALNADMDSLRRSGRDFTAYPRETNLEDLLFRYGARINHDLVQDRQSDVLPQTVGMIGDQPQIELLPWPYFPLLYSMSNHPIAKNLDAVVMQFPNSVDTVAAAGIKKEILLASSNTSRLIGTPVIVTVEVLKELENPSAYKQQYIPLAILLEGHFKSLYANRVNPAMAASLSALGVPFVGEAKQPGKVLVTGDGDWVLNAISRQGPLPMGANPFTQYQFANSEFLLNAIDYMTDESGIMATRNKDFALRLLDPKQLEKNAVGWRWFNIGLPLILIIVFAGIYTTWRRKRFVK